MMPPILSHSEAFLLIADDMYPPPTLDGPEPEIDLAAVAERMKADIEVVLAVVRYFASPEQGCIVARFDNECRFTARGRKMASELEARLLRNAANEKGPEDPRASLAAADEIPVAVTQRESNVLKLLATAHDQKLPRAMMPQRVGDPSEIVEAEILELYIKGLVSLSERWVGLTPKGRKSLEDAGPSRLFRMWTGASKGLKLVTGIIVALAALITALGTIEGKFANLFIHTAPSATKHN